MSRESKIFSVNNGESVQTKVKHYESFGWELLSINGSGVSMTRETQNPVYADLVKHEAQYEELCQKRINLQTQFVDDSFNIKEFLILCLLLIFPGVLYAMSNKKKKTHNQEIANAIANTSKEIEDVCNESRTIFFSKQ